MGKPSKDKPRKVLANYKRVGKRLVPPIMQLGNIKTFSYADSILPDLVWLSALFLRTDHKTCVRIATKFCEHAHEAIDMQDLAPLGGLSSFQGLSKENKELVRQAADVHGLREIICNELRHQYDLLDNYPLAFLFTEERDCNDHETKIDKLTADVSALLDRHSLHSTRVQTTFYHAQLTSGKIKFASHIKIPNFDSIFTDPDGEEARRVGSFVRSGMNAFCNMREKSDAEASWPDQFWTMAYQLRGCL